MTPHPRTIRRTASRHRGSAYVLVLAVTMLVSVIGVAVGIQARINARQARMVGDSGEAQVLATSAMEFVVLKIDNAVQAEQGGGAPWRNQFTDGQVIGPISFGNGSFTYMLKDATDDGDIANDPSHPVDVYVTARVGQNVQRQKLQMEPAPVAGSTPPPMVALDYAVLSNETIDFKSCTVNSDRALATNDKSDASDASIYADIEAVEEITGDNYYGANNAYVFPPKPMPNVSTFDYYINNGTVIDYNDLEDHGGSIRWIWGRLLSPSSNPFGGGTNPSGIYVVNCHGDDIGISESRIVGTLVLIDPGSDSVVEGSINWEPAVSNYPALLVKKRFDGGGKADITFRLTDTPLRESATDWGLLWTLTYTLKVPNFNRSGTPWQGNTDLDTFDEYPSGIAGLIYVEGKLTVAPGSYGNTTGIAGVVITDELKVESGATLNLLYKDTFFNDPPPGFASGSAPSSSAGPMQIVVGSWRRVMN